ncbi:MAG: four-helix bundle copper-binding protein [Burkholderiales bacterium]
MTVGINEDMQRCIEICNECSDICLNTLTQHCLNMGGKHVEAEHVCAMLDCVDICETAARFMLRGSDVHADICAACAKVCERCAESCERFDDTPMRACADICRRCADSCLDMAGVTA